MFTVLNANYKDEVGVEALPLQQLGTFSVLPIQKLHLVSHLLVLFQEAIPK
jgi:hypothetical protein